MFLNESWYVNWEISPTQNVFKALVLSFSGVVSNRLTCLKTFDSLGIRI